MRNPLTQLKGLAAAMLLLCTAAPLAAQEIGVVASITPQMSGQPPGQGVRILGQGAGVVTEELIVTGAQGRGQLLFRDQTTLTVASSSQVVLDRFVYDPNQGTGEIGLSITRGALRFIGGATSDRQEAEIVTPTGTIGIRGSSVLVLVEEDGSTIVIFVAGDRLCFSVLGGRRHCTNRTGGMLTENGYMGQVTPAFLAQILARIDGPLPTVGGGGSGNFGSGLPNDNPSHRGTVSTSGESYDQAGFDADFNTLAVEGLVSGGSSTPGGFTFEPPDDDDDDDDDDIDFDFDDCDFDTPVLFCD